LAAVCLWLSIGFGVVSLILAAVFGIIGRRHLSGKIGMYGALGILGLAVALAALALLSFISGSSGFKGG
jgi:hypothetical protein